MNTSIYRAMMNQGSSYSYLSWSHYVAGTCGPSCPYCPNFSPDEPCTTLSSPSIAPPVANHDSFSQTQSTVARPEGTMSTLSIGIGHDDRAGVAGSGSAYAYSTPPGSFHGYQNSYGVYRPMDAHYQRVEDTYINIDPPSRHFDDRNDVLQRLEVPEVFDFRGQTLNDTPPIPDPALPRPTFSSPSTPLPHGRPPMTYRSNPPSIDTNDVIRYVPAAGRLMFVCSEPQCYGRTFGRRQEFVRHYNGAHAPPDVGNMFWCAVPSCDRGIRPFPRRDKLNDHVRKVHMLVVESASSDMLGG